MDALANLWAGAGLDAVATQQITVNRIFTDFEDYWNTIRGGPRMGARLAAMAPDRLARLRARMQEHLSQDASGRITCGAQANAVKGRVPR
jgi:hypothetical protein